jgi:hypothetical protein
MLRVFESGLALIVLWWLALTAANAGPPYRTDDPEPTPLGHYEFYTFSTGTVVRDDTLVMPSVNAHVFITGTPDLRR